MTLCCHLETQKGALMTGSRVQDLVLLAKTALARAARRSAETRRRQARRRAARAARESSAQRPRRGTRVGDSLAWLTRARRAGRRARRRTS